MSEQEPPETCAWCARRTNQGHRPNCPRPGEVFTATDLRNARAEATAAAEQRLREAIEAVPLYDENDRIVTLNGSVREVRTRADAAEAIKTRILALFDTPAPRETFRDHETCVPHDHVEPDADRWERDQAASLAGLTHGDWCEQTIRPTEHADTDSAFLHNDHCRDSRAASPRQGEPVDVERLARALHDEFWDDTMDHAATGDRACIEMEVASAERILAALSEPAEP